MPDDALMEVIFRAVADEKFFTALVKDVDGSLRSANIKLSTSQVERLKKALQDPPTTAKIDLPALLREIHARHVQFRWVGFSWMDPTGHDYHDED